MLSDAITTLGPCGLPMTAYGSFAGKTSFVPPVLEPPPPPEPPPPRRSRRSRLPKAWWDTMPVVDPFRALRRWPHS